MKAFILLFVYLALTDTVDSGEWLNDFDQAKQEAKQGNRKILLNFSGSDWCAPCIKMKKDVFEKPEFGDYAAKHLVLVRADFPRHKKNQLSTQQTAHNEQLAEKYNSQGKFPFTLLLDAEGKVIQTWDGYQDATVNDFIKQIDKYVDED
jgi:thioredoxin-related protein